MTNQGAIATLATSTGYYLSQDPVIDAADARLIGSRSVPGLAVGASNSGSRVVTVPTLAPGTYYLFACADDKKTAVESNETNNCRSSATTVTIGLSPTAEPSR